MANPAAPPLLVISSPDDCCSPIHHNQTLNAVSFGFIATAVLFAMFLIMAIFERVLRPQRTFQSRNNGIDEERAEMPTPGPSDSQKPELRRIDSYSKAVSVLMPGHDYPTYFARLIPSPLAPEGVEWPSHAESSQHDATTLEHCSSKKEPRVSTDIPNLSEKGTTSRIGVIIGKNVRENGTSSEKGGTTST
ncbi:unnamed protein product [Calypogeia fissa]